MKRVYSGIIILILATAMLVTFLFLQRDRQDIPGAPGNVVEVVFELDKNFEFGEYYFDLDNGKSADFPLCFCLSEKNMFPPECSGHVKYIYRNQPGTMCVPLNIGRGSCSNRIMSSSHFASVFYIPLEYQWVNSKEKIVIGIIIPRKIPEGVRLAVQVNVFRRGMRGDLKLYRTLEQTIKVVY